MKKIHLCLVTFGVIIGVVGILHGCAELLRGSSLVGVHAVEALPPDWPNAQFYGVMKGAPVFSLLTGVPFFVLGLLAISVSVTLIVVSVTFLRGDVGLSKRGLAVFALLNVGVFLFGAGEGTPIAIGLPTLIVGALSLGMTKMTSRSLATGEKLSAAFYMFYGLQIFSWVLFFPGLFVLSFYGEIPWALFMFDFWIMPVSILGALSFGMLHDRSTFE